MNSWKISKRVISQKKIKNHCIFATIFACNYNFLIEATINVDLIHGVFFEVRQCFGPSVEL